MSARPTTVKSNSSLRAKTVEPVGWFGSSTSSGYFLLLSLVTTLCLFGLMMVLSSSSVDALRTYGSSWVFFKRQIVWLVLGSAGLFVTTRLDYHRWAAWSKVLIVASLAMLFVVLIPGVGITVSGSRRWLGVGSLRMQPSEIAKLAMLMFSADLLSRRHQFMHDWKKTVRPVCLMFLCIAALVMVEPDMGTTLLLGCLTIVLLYVAGTPIKTIGTMLSVAVGAATLLALVEPYRRARLFSFLDPFKDAGNSGYQIVQSLIGIGSGGITGVGLGASRAKWGFLPNAHTDFIFAIIAEELGLIGAVLVVFLFIAFAVLGVRTACRAPDRYGMLLSSGITALVVAQAFLNIGAVIGILPVTGVPLPFLSQGGSSLVILMVSTGILLNIARQSEEPGHAEIHLPRT